MSEHDDPGHNSGHNSGLDELERHLDAAFATTRPRRDFEDDLWERLRARGAGRPQLRGWRFPWAAASGVAVLLVVVLGVFVLVQRGPHGGAGGTSTASQAAPSGASSGQAAATAPLPQGAVAAPLGRLPAPAGAGVPEVVQDSGGLSPLPGRASLVFIGISLPAVGPSSRVYSYDPASGPGDGTIVEVSAVPQGLRAADYPTRQPNDGLTEAVARAAGTDVNLPAPPNVVTLTAARLVYVAVVSGGQGYLEPAYLFTGTVQDGGSTASVRVLVPALEAASLR